MLKVCKFGGTSLADAAAMEGVAQILLADKTRRFIIVSAPGKRSKDDTKVTDMLYACAAEARTTGSCKASFAAIAKRFKDIVAELKLKVDIDKHLNMIQETIDANKGDSDYAASRGEYLSAVIMAARLGYPFVDAVSCIKYKDNGALDSELTNELTSKALLAHKYAVIPGFYGSMSDGRVRTFSRGGSDITGSIVARAVEADLYENWTDVDGFLVADPRIVSEPKMIDTLSYRELRELSYMGAQVLHSEAVFPVRAGNITIEIKNTFSPEKQGTRIVASESYDTSGKVITGIAGKKNFSAITIEKEMMNNELGFCRRVLSVCEEEGVSIEHIPTGIDTMCLIIETSLIKGKEEKLLSKMQSVTDADRINLSGDMALIAIVGHGMEKKMGTAARLTSVIANAGINIRMIDQGSSELNIIVGINNADYEKCVSVIYKEFLEN